MLDSTHSLPPLDSEGDQLYWEEWITWSGF